MNDDAFVRPGLTTTDPRLKLAAKNGADVARLERLVLLLSPEDKLQPFGLSAPRVFAHLDGNPGATVDDLVMATGLAARTVRSVLKNTGIALVEQGHLALVETAKRGRKHIYSLAHDWAIRLNDLRGSLSTNGLIVARTIHHASERIQRIGKFLENATRDGRRKLDAQTRLQYEQIKARAHALQARLSGHTLTQADAQIEALVISENLVTVEAQIEPVKAEFSAPHLFEPSVPVMPDRPRACLVFAPVKPDPDQTMRRMAAAAQARQAIEENIRRNQGATAATMWLRERMAVRA